MSHGFSLYLGDLNRQRNCVFPVSGLNAKSALKRDHGFRKDFDSCRESSGVDDDSGVAGHLAQADFAEVGTADFSEVFLRLFVANLARQDDA